MPINYAFGIPLVLALTFSTGFLSNEWSHGGLSEAMGVGHRHLLDFGGYHCVAHNDPIDGDLHVAHMHQAGDPMPHEGCAGGAAMHQMGNMSGMPASGMGQDGMGMMP